ncbi:hypothetical protein VP01_3110g1 [Puccinia sorghi]|uniref:Uncharacterized protein n=1 Tax=Puccinia sorghi TaxID=27349 RepID=A0A0L6UZB6_9BASI|nr:hypothetical protein VP01_3110g1 [Puccinia sorghi]
MTIITSYQALIGEQKSRGNQAQRGRNIIEREKEANMWLHMSMKQEEQCLRKKSKERKEDAYAGVVFTNQVPSLCLRTLKARNDSLPPSFVDKCNTKWLRDKSLQNQTLIVQRFLGRVAGKHWIRLTQSVVVVLQQLLYKEYGQALKGEEGDGCTTLNVGGEFSLRLTVSLWRSPQRDTKSFYCSFGVLKFILCPPEIMVHCIVNYNLLWESLLYYKLQDHCNFGVYFSASFLTKFELHTNLACTCISYSGTNNFIIFVVSCGYSGVSLRLTVLLRIFMCQTCGCVYLRLFMCQTCGCRFEGFRLFLCVGNVQGVRSYGRLKGVTYYTFIFFIILI